MCVQNIKSVGIYPTLIVSPDTCLQLRALACSAPRFELEAWTVGKPSGDGKLEGDAQQDVLRKLSKSELRWSVKFSEFLDQKVLVGNLQFTLCPGVLPRLRTCPLRAEPDPVIGETLIGIGMLRIAVRARFWAHAISFPPQ